MQISYDGLIFRDFMNFSSPMSLQKFAQSCGITEISKDIFPYERFRSVRELLDTTIFPKYGEFRSSLQKSFDNNYLTELNQIVKSKLDDGDWSSLTDFFLYYDIKEPSDDFSIENGNSLKYNDSGLEKLKESLHISPAAYEISRAYFDDNCRHMGDYLRYYNNLDVELLLQARVGEVTTFVTRIRSYRSTIRKLFGIFVCIRKSLR